VRLASPNGIMVLKERAQRVKEGTIVSIFPAKILLATDGSSEASLALTTAADIAKSTDS
jgi:hypothetical protein